MNHNFFENNLSNFYPFDEKYLLHSLSVSERNLLQRGIVDIGLYYQGQICPETYITSVSDTEISGRCGMLSDETFTIDITGASRMGTYNNYDSDDKVKGYVIIGEPEALSDGISVPIRVLSTRIKVFINYAGNLIVKNEPRCRLFDLPDIEEEKNVITSGDINFVPGYNCEIKVIDNTITLIPVIGAGKGIMTAIDNGEGQPIDLPISEAEKQYFADNLTGKTYYAGIQNSGSGYLMSLNGAAGANIFIDGLSKINVSNFNPLDPTLSQNTVLIQAVNLAKC